MVREVLSRGAEALLQQMQITEEEQMQIRSQVISHGLGEIGALSGDELKEAVMRCTLAFEDHDDWVPTREIISNRAFQFAAEHFAGEHERLQQEIWLPVICLAETVFTKIFEMHCKGVNEVPEKIPSLQARVIQAISSLGE